MVFLRNCVQRGVVLQRRQFPRGFLVVAVVHATREACGGEEPAEGQDWLWSGAVLGQAHLATHASADELPHKRLTFTVEVGGLSDCVHSNL